MGVQRFSSVDAVDAGSASFTAIGTSVTRTVLWPGKVATPIPAYDMRAGKKYVLEAGGIVSYTATPTIIFDPLIGPNGTTADTSMGVSATASCPVGTTIANVSWYLRYVMVVRTVGIAAATAAVTGNGYAFLSGNAANPSVTIGMGALTSVTTVDQTVINYLDVAQTWGTSSASNTIQCQWVTLETKN